MASMTGWIIRLLVRDRPGEPLAPGLAVWLSVSSDESPGEADVLLEAIEPDRACAMLRSLSALGTVARVHIALSPDLPPGDRRRIARAARRLRSAGIAVELPHG